MNDQEAISFTSSVSKRIFDAIKEEMKTVDEGTIISSLQYNKFVSYITFSLVDAYFKAASNFTEQDKRDFLDQLLSHVKHSVLLTMNEDKMREELR